MFILNSDNDVDDKTIFADPGVPKDLADVLPKRNKSNVFVKRRPNTCFNLGAHYDLGAQWRDGRGGVVWKGWRDCEGAGHGE